MVSPGLPCGRQKEFYLFSQSSKKILKLKEFKISFKHKQCCTTDSEDTTRQFGGKFRSSKKFEN